SPISSFFTRRPIESDVMAPHVMAAAKKSILECQKGHSQCGKSASLPRLPVRVLDVSEAQRSSTIRLYVTKKTGEYDNYVTLSYCWGGPQPIVATKATLKQLQTGIRAASLPQTLQDAVKVTSALGFRYLWVDALCIVQDDNVDKMNEIGSMDQVYGNSTLTISAAVAATVREGFVKYPRREPFVAVPAELPNGKKGDVFVAPCIEADFADLPLQTRGWTLQEWLLPSRILFYGDRELVFQCRTAGTRGVCPSYMSYDTANRNTGRIVDHRLRMPSAAERGRLWLLFMREFSARQLTVASDRMNAMIGIQKALSSSWKDECIAGLWKSTFPVCLAWECKMRVKPAPKGRTGWAPSWSWLSVD
ncbi:HET-domain-containing protein, partial [Sodiomyces alkalinus F11]